MGSALKKCCRRHVSEEEEEGGLHCDDDDEGRYVQNGLKKKGEGYASKCTALVIEGGGAKGVALGGTLLALEEFKILSGVKRIAGSSAGAICACLLSVGFSANEIVDLLVETDMRKFLDDKFGVFRDAYNLLHNYGCCPGDFFLNWVESLLAKKTGISGITFQQVFSTYGIDLRITSVCLNTGKLVMFSPRGSPDMQVSKAVRMSMSIPFVFEPVKHEGRLYVDGGVGCNYPLHVFDDDYVPSETLGLKMMGDSEKVDKYITSTDHRDIHSITDFAGYLVEFLLARIERLEVDTDYWERTLIVPTGTIDTMDFHLSEKQKRDAISMSYKYACQQINDE